MGREEPTYKGREVKGQGREGGEEGEGEGQGNGWKGRGREMEGSTYKGRKVKGGEGRGKGRRRVAPVITVSPGSRGAKIVTGCHHHIYHP